MRRLLPLVVALAGCGQAPYDPYWADDAAFPTLDAVEPGEVQSLIGGQEVTLRGTGLGTARTVVIGDRNADILALDDSAVTVAVPARSGGGGPVDVGVVTDTGFARLKSGFTYSNAATGWWRDEVASAALVVVDCPVEAWAYWTDEWYPIFWCGLEMGYAYAVGSAGTSTQAGFAGDLAGIVELSALPPVGETVVWGPRDPRPPGLPSRYGRYIDGDGFDITTPRDFERDRAYVARRQDILSRVYSWYDDVTAEYETVALYDDDQCYTEDVGVVSASGDTLTVDTDVTGASGMWLGYAIEETGGYYTEGHTSSAWVTASGSDLVGDPSGVWLAYDDYSGTFDGAGPAGFLGQADLPFAVSYDVTGWQIGAQVATAQVAGAEALVLTSPNLLSGLEQIVRGTPMTFEWEPAASDDPTFVVIEVRVFDYDIVHPTWVQEVARLVAHADDAAGAFTLDPGDLDLLPLAGNQVNDDDVFGLWGEVTIARHQLRKVDLGSGDLVIDFVHAINTPIDIAAP